MISKLAWEEGASPTVNVIANSIESLPSHLDLRGNRRWIEVVGGALT